MFLKRQAARVPVETPMILAAWAARMNSLLGVVVVLSM